MRILFLTLFIAAASTLECRPFLIWTQASYRAPIDENTSFFQAFEARFRDGLNDPYTTYIDTFLIRNISKQNDVRPGVRFISQKGEYNTWQKSAVLLLAFVSRFDLKTIKAETRNRFEYNLRSGNPTFRLREMLSYPTKYGEPYLFNEFFFSRAFVYTQNRLQAGLRKELFEGTQGSLAYMWISRREKGGWSSSDVLYFMLSKRF